MPLSPQHRHPNQRQSKVGGTSQSVAGQNAKTARMAVAELTLDKQTLKEALEGNF